MVITSRRQEAVDEYNQQAGDNSFAVLADASKPEQNEQVFKTVSEKFGKPKSLIGLSGALMTDLSLRLINDMPSLWLSKWA